MEGVLLKINEIADSLPPSERKVANVILSAPGEVVLMSIDEIALASSVSTASVVRLSKRLGCTGYKELCRDISIDLAVRQNSTKYEAVFPGASMETIIQATCRTDINAITNTMSLIDLKQFEKAVDALAKAPRVDFYGVGASGIVALDGCYKFMRLNKASLSLGDSHYQCVMASTLKAGDVGVFISYSGTTFDILDMISAAKRGGATIISITKYGTNPVSEQADIKLYVDNSESALKLGAIGSRIGDLAIIDALFTTVSSKLFDDVKEHLDETHEILNKKRSRIKAIL